jgi:hypothetical protein
VRAWLILAVALCASCADDFASVDGAVPGDGGGADLSVADGGGALAGAFTIVGCTTLDQSMVVPQCTANAPATLTFVPLAAGVTDFVWSFPGGTPSSSKAITPQVTYAQPGMFVVTLAAGGPAGTTVSNGQIHITAGGIGDVCGSTGDCDPTQQLECICGTDQSCPGALSVGLCTRPCAPGACAPGEVCADLERGFVADMPDGGEPDGGADSDEWRSTLCLRGCTANTDCRVGLTCREVPALTGGTAGGPFVWQKACFSDALGGVGAACDGPDGQPAGDSCLSGRCDPLGARGICTSDCASTACPTYAACAAFNTSPAQHLCLHRCDATHPCTDPLLDCLPAGGAGNLGFTVMPPDPAGTTYCAPRKCSMPTDCAPAGTCTSGFCSKL